MSDLAALIARAEAAEAQRAALAKRVEELERDLAAANRLIEKGRLMIEHPGWHDDTDEDTIFSDALREYCAALRGAEREGGGG